MNVFDKLPRRFKNRFKLIIAAIFSKSNDLEKTMASIQKAPDVVLLGWGNPYVILTKHLPQYGCVDNDILRLTDRKNTKTPQKKMSFDFCIILYVTLILKS